MPLREQGTRRRGRKMLIWEDWVKRDERMAGEEEDWKKTTSNISHNMATKEAQETGVEQTIR